MFNLDRDDERRRNTAAREALLQKFRREILHSPGLALTADQASRLFGVPKDVCARLLTRLVQEGAIVQRPDGRFVGVGAPD